MLTLNGAKPNCRSSYYNKESEIMPKIIDLAKDSYHTALQESIDNDFS